LQAYCVLANVQKSDLITHELATMNSCAGKCMLYGYGIDCRHPTNHPERLRGRHIREFNN
jgi:hypothetical protein